MNTLLDVCKQRDEYLKCGKRIELKINARPVMDFRITYSNPNTYTTYDGGCIVKDSIKVFSNEIFQQLMDNGYYVEPCDDYFSEDCADVFLREKDKLKEYPRLKVYVHPEEMAGWAPYTHVKRLLKIVENNPTIRNVKLVYIEKVYNNIDDAKYLDILKESEPQIIEWLNEYQEAYGDSGETPGEVFNRIFGIKRLSVSHLSYRDYVAIKYVNNIDSC